MANRRISMGQTLKQLGGEDFPLRQFVHKETLMFVNSALTSLPEDLQQKVFEALNAAKGDSLTLSLVVCESLLSPGSDEVKTSMSRADRLALAMRLNTTAVRRISDEDIKKIMPYVEHYYKGALIAPQAEMLLRGETFSLLPNNEDEADES